MSVTARTGENEVTILARVFDDERGLLPRNLAGSIWKNVDHQSLRR